MKRLKVAYISIFDSTDVHSWSGLGYYISKTVEKYVGDIDYIGNLKTKRYFEYELKNAINKFFFKKHLLRDITPKVVKNYAREIEERIKGRSYDLIFCPGTIQISALETNIPIVCWSDNCQPGLFDTYIPTNKVSKESFKHSVDIEKAALEKASLILYASESAASIAINYHHINSNKIKVVPWGANIDHHNTKDNILSFIKRRPKDVCKLLFIGVEWIRKGGDIALGVAKKLNKMGLKTELTIVGCEPEVAEPLPQFVNSLGFLSKSTKDGREHMNKLFEESHFLIVPSQAEAYGLVFCEANSFGVPAISRKLGGITTIIRDDINGKTFEKDADVTEYVDYIYDLMNDREKYRRLCMLSFNEYKTRLNWDTAGQTVRELIEEILDKKTTDDMVA